MAASSERWEVVTHKKKPTFAEKKAAIKSLNENKGPKIEELDPVPQSKNSYDAFTESEDRKKKVLQQQNEQKKLNDINKKNQQEKLQQPEIKKKHHSKKRQRKEDIIYFKTLEEALKSFSMNDIMALLADVKSKFPNNPLIWLKDLTSFLNIKLVVKDTNVVLEGFPLDYPACQLSNDLRKFLLSVLNECSEILEYFYESCITEMVDEIPKGMPNYGYRIFIQLIAFNQPKYATVNLSKWMERLSNQKLLSSNMSLAILWSCGQMGIKDAALGVKVWLELMLPLLESKTLAGYVVSYLCHILSSNKVQTIKQTAYFPILDIIFLNSAQLQPGLKKKVSSIYPNLKEIIFGEKSNANLSSYFPSFLTRLTKSLKETQEEELLSCLEQCLLRQPAQSFSVWRQLYTKHLPESATLLAHLASQWHSRQPKEVTVALRSTIHTFSLINDELKTKSSEENKALSQSKKACQELIERVRTYSYFPWKTLMALLFLTIATTLTYDISRQGYDSSQTAKYLKNSGLEAVRIQAWSRISFYASRGAGWARANLPVYYEQAREFCDPYLVTFKRSLYQLGLGVLEASQPLRTWLTTYILLGFEWVESQVPLIREQILILADLLQQLAFTILKIAKFYASAALKVIWDITGPYISSAYQWMQDNNVLPK